MESEGVRHFENPNEEYDEERCKHVVYNGKLTKSCEQSLKSSLLRLLSRLEQELRNYKDRDNSIYTGSAGIGLLYFHLSETIDKVYLSNALTYSRDSTKNLKMSRVSFLCGDAGPLALSAVVNDKLGKSKECQKDIERLEDMHRSALSSDTPDEVLYGRSGYIYSLLFIQKHIQKSTVNEAIIRKAIDRILESGQELSKEKRLGRECPLFYTWHDKPYLGAAHGLVGILYMLLQGREYISAEQLETLVKPTILYVHSLRFKSGNFPSSLGSSTDKLVHWCHGAPGAVHLMALAYQVFGESIFLEAAESCCEVIWERGLLRKGYGICHGVSGNAYAFLCLKQLTGQDKHLYRAYKFAEWCFRYGEHGCDIPDRPLSLFEGLAGTIYFLVDMMNPDNSAFPAFQLF